MYREKYFSSKFLQKNEAARLFQDLFLFLFFSITKKSKQIFENKNFEKEKNFKGKIESIFHHFSKAFSCPELSHTWECSFKGVARLILKYIWNMFKMQLPTQTNNCNLGKYVTTDKK